MLAPLAQLTASFGRLFAGTSHAVLSESLERFSKFILASNVGQHLLIFKRNSRLAIAGDAAFIRISGLAEPHSLPHRTYALPLQQFIAEASGWILIKIGINVRVEEIYLYVNDRIVEVAPHCAGLKMLFTSLYVSLILLDWTGLWNSRKKSLLFLVITSIISISSNIFRNTLLTYFHGTEREGLFAWLHAGWGGDLYSACILGLFVLLLNGMENYFPSQSGN